MASNENQGLQISLIVFVMLTIILSVTTFVFYRKFEQEATAQSETAMPTPRRPPLTKAWPSRTPRR